MSGPVRLALIGSGIKMSMAKAFHELAGTLSGIEVTYDLIDRDASSRADIPVSSIVAGTTATRR